MVASASVCQSARRRQILQPMVAIVVAIVAIMAVVVAIRFGFRGHHQRRAAPGWRRLVSCDGHLLTSDL